MGGNPPNKTDQIFVHFPIRNNYFAVNPFWQNLPKRNDADSKFELVMGVILKNFSLIFMTNKNYKWEISVNFIITYFIYTYIYFFLTTFSASHRQDNFISPECRHKNLPGNKSAAISSRLGIFIPSARYMYIYIYTADRDGNFCLKGTTFRRDGSSRHHGGLINSPLGGL